MRAGRSVPRIASMLAAGALAAGALFRASVAAPAGGPTSPAAYESADVITRAIERRPPARALSEAARVDERTLTASDLERLARDSKQRWSRTSHGPMLLRILPERLRPAELPQPGTRVVIRLAPFL